MRVAFVNSTRKWGGVKTWTLELGAWLAARGHQVDVVARPGVFAQACEKAGLQTLATSFGPDGNPLLILRLAKLFKQRGTQLVVVNVGKDLRSAGVAAKFLNLGLIMRVGLPGDLRDTWKTRLQHRALAPAYLTPSQDTRAGLLARLPFLNPGEVTAIHTGKAISPEPPPPAQTPLRLITTSRLDPDKGHADLLETLAELMREGLDFSLTIVGSGSQEAELKTQAAALNLSERVTFAGFSTRVRDELTQADVFVLPSYNEGLPNALLEAMAQGLCPVARAVGGVAEVWPGALNELLAPPEPGSLAEPLRQMLTAGSEAVSGWKRLAWEHAREHFDLETQALALETYLEEHARP